MNSAAPIRSHSGAIQGAILVFREISERKQQEEELRKQVAALAIAGAEKILARQIDQAANSDIVDKLVAEL